MALNEYHRQKHCSALSGHLNTFPNPLAPSAPAALLSLYPITHSCRAGQLLECFHPSCGSPWERCQLVFVTESLLSNPRWSRFGENCFMQLFFSTCDLKTNTSYAYCVTGQELITRHGVNSFKAHTTHFFFHYSSFHKAQHPLPAASWMTHTLDEPLTTSDSCLMALVLVVMVLLVSCWVVCLQRRRDDGNCNWN